MAIVKISEISELKNPVEAFNFLGVNMTTTPINNRMSFGTISSNIYNTTYNAAHADSALSIISLSNALSADIKSQAEYNKSKFNELNNLIDAKAAKTDLNRLSTDFMSISSGICAEVKISVDNLTTSVDNLTLDLKETSALLNNQFSLSSNQIINTLSVIATDELPGYVKFKENESTIDEFGYIKCGLTADEDGKAYVKILSSTAGGGGSGGSTPIGYDAVQISAAYGKAANLLLTSDSEIKNLSASNNWYYLSTYGSTTLTVTLNSVRDEIVRSIENRLSIEKDLDQAISDIDEIKNTGAGKVKYIPNTAHDQNLVLVSSDISNIIGTNNTTVDDTTITTDVITYLNNTYADAEIGKHVILTTINKIYYKDVDTIVDETVTYTWREYADSSKTLFYNKLDSDNRYALKTAFASDSEAGVIKLGYTKQNNNYPVSIDDNGAAYVSIESPSYSIPYASSTDIGGMKIGFEESSERNEYAVKLDVNGQAYVKIATPTYTIPAATADSYGGIKTGYVETSEQNNYAVKLTDAEGKAYVTVPECNDMSENMFKQVYPIGAVYVSTVNTNPSELFNFGTWVDITKTDSESWTTKTIYAFERTA